MAARLSRESFSSLAKEWDGLLSRAFADNLFLSHQWQHLWWKHFGLEEELFLLAFREGGELFGIAPLVQRGETIFFLGDSDLFDYHEFVVAKGKEELFYDSFEEFLASNPWKTLSLFSIPKGSPTLEYLPLAAKNRGWGYKVAVEDSAPGISLPGSWDAYLSSLSKKDRHELRRKLRRLEERAPTYRYYALSSHQDIDGSVGDFLRLMKESREEKSRFMTQEREEFFRSMVEKLSSEGVLRLYFMEMDSARVASAICFDYKGTRFLYNSGFDPQLSYLSVGLLLKALCLRDAIEKGMSYFDFLRGNERYKYDLGAQEGHIYTIEINR